jgi:hypothetical protein
MNPVAEVIMKNKQQTNFIWCPVCMVHTYHKRGDSKWICINDDHAIFLRLRDDPWIKEYRRSESKKLLPIEQLG